MIFNALQRIENKIEEQHASATSNAQSPPKRIRRASSINSELLSPGTDAQEPTGSYNPVEANDTSTSPAQTAESTNSIVIVPHVPVIQYPIRQIATWPAARTLLRSTMKASWAHRYNASCATLIEQTRPAMPAPVPTSSPSVDWTAQLHISLVKDLCDNYFSTFNLTHPIVDRQLFSQHSLSVAINSEFGFNIESSLVLMVMALGSLGKKALQEAGFIPIAGDTPAITQVHVEGESANDSMIFFNEARKRIGFLNCDNSVQGCQFYLLSGYTRSFVTLVTKGSNT